MEKDILLSIVIPVYNVQDYIGKCLNSLKTLDERVEILVVDDGSPDKSFEVSRIMRRIFRISIILRRKMVELVLHVI